VVVVHVATSAAVDVALRNQTATSAPALNEFGWARAPAVKFHMAPAAQRHPVIKVESQIQCGRIALYVVRRESLLMLFALPTAAPAAIPVARKNSISPLDVRRIAESLPWAATLPEGMTRAAKDAVVLALRRRGFGDRFR